MEAQFIKKLNNTETELKKSVAFKKDRAVTFSDFVENQKRIQGPIKHLRWNVLRKNLFWQKSRS